jgi:hypothetical protein
VPLAEIPNIMRALGYYPSELEVQNMCSEVMYSRYAETGESADSINLEDLIQLYINHRPVFGVGKEQIQQAFQILTGKTSKTRNTSLTLHAPKPLTQTLTLRWWWWWWWWWR